MPDAATLFEKHRGTLEQAVHAIHTREFHAHWPEVPSGKIYGETAQVDGEAAFRALLNSRFGALGQDGEAEWSGTEESPYGFPLGVSYPRIDTGVLVERAKAAFPAWNALSPKERAGLLVEALEVAAKSFFPIAYATMHTTGQSFLMAFQASGPHGFDRALEAVALGLHEQTRFPESAEWEKPVGKATVKLRRRYRAVGRGVALAIGCSTFPIWNSFPAIFADLVTGNTVIVKPHQRVILPMAIAVADVRRVLREYGMNPDILQLAVDGEVLIAKDLARHPDVRIIDYTGGSAFGEWLEALPGKIVFTEKAGVNSVVLDSVEQLDPALDNIAFSVSLYSGQMCTTPQNIFIPNAGVREGGSVVPYDEVVSRLAAKIDGLAKHEKMGPGTLGAIQNPATLERVASVPALGCRVVLQSAPVAQPGFPSARSISPLLAEVQADRADIFMRELFGPVAFVIPTESTAQSIELAAATAMKAGSITFAAYATDPATMDAIEAAMALAGAPVAFNLTGPIWVNQSATFSDFHVTGGNPSGNASLVDPAFIVRRFFFVGSRTLA